MSKWLSHLGKNCYCNPSLKQDRPVLDPYCTDLSTEAIHEGEG